MIEYFEDNSHKFGKIRGTLAQDSAAPPVSSSGVESLARLNGSTLRNKAPKSKHSLSDCFGKLIEASMRVFWS